MIGINGDLTLEVAQSIAEKFVEVVIARSVGEAALSALAAKKNLRVLTAEPPGLGADYRVLDGGFLQQDRDQLNLEGWEVVSQRQPTEEEMESLRFAWVVVAHSKSNSIVIANGSQAVGIGVGDQSRIGAGERAVLKAGDRAKGGVAASDAFFPFRDGLDVLAEAGVSAVVQPGGSRNDQELIDAADEHGIALVFTGMRHFKH